jgi:non-ribosomal peptide synthase protein (TIGR01720 family)
VRPDLPGAAELAREPALAFRYLGPLDRRFAGPGLLAADPALPGVPLVAGRGPRARRAVPVEVTAYSLDGRLRLAWRFGPARIRRPTVEALAERHLAELREVVEHCLDPEAGAFTPSDFPAADLDQEALDDLLARVRSS